MVAEPKSRNNAIRISPSSHQNLAAESFLDTRRKTTARRAIASVTALIVMSRGDRSCLR